MRNSLLAAALLSATALAAPALAQDVPATPADTYSAPAPAAPADPYAAPAPAPAPESYSQTANEPASEPAAAPDGTRAFGFEPYVAVLGGYERFDRRPGHGIPATPIGGNNLDGALVQGIVGFNVPLGPVFVGAEGNVTKGVKGDIDWQYGAAGRFGFRAGESGLFYGKVGYQWVNFDRADISGRDFDAITYGIGAEVGPKDIGLGGITGNSGVRFRLEVSTFGSADSFRPMAGAVLHF